MCSPPATDAEPLVTRPKDLMDNATPSAQSLAACGLLRLAALTGESRYDEHARRIIELFSSAAAQHPTAFGRALEAVDMAVNGLDEIAVVGDRADLVNAVQTRYLPTAVLAWGEPYDSPLWQDRAEGFAYVCRNFACQSPRSHRRGADQQTRSLIAGSGLSHLRVPRIAWPQFLGQAGSRLGRGKSAMSPPSRSCPARRHEFFQA